MILALGKLSLESDKASLKASCAFDAVEVELLNYFGWKTKTKIQFKAWVKKNKLCVIPRLSLKLKREASEYQELFTIWDEEWKACTLYYSVYSGSKSWDQDRLLSQMKRLPSDRSFFFEWAQEDRAKNASFIAEFSQFQGFVVDPVWHQKHMRSLKNRFLRFKLHGWNEERWVRRYGPSQAQKIMNTLKNYPEASLVLAYSGRFAETDLFKQVV